MPTAKVELRDYAKINDTLVNKAMKLKLLFSMLLLYSGFIPLYATFMVNSNADTPDAVAGDGFCADISGQCTLRAAIEEANSAGVNCTITFGLGGATIITLTSALPTITTDIVITDPLMNVIIDGANMFNLFTVMGTDATFNGLTLQNAGGFVSGAAISNQAGTVRLTNSMLAGNTTGSFGGAIYNTSGGTFFIEKSTITDNISTGFLGAGGILNSGTMTITESMISNNRAGPRGGGIYNDGTLTLTSSTVSGNSISPPTATDPGGGGIYGGSSSMTTITNSTISGNTAGEGAGGGIGSIGATVLDNNTIVNNTANTGGGVDVRGGDIDMNSTIIANSIASAGAIQDLLVNSATDFGINSNNLVETCSSALSCPTFSVTADPQLKALADNGGCTQTHLPCLGSPVIDAGETGISGTTDQRSLGAPIDDLLTPNTGAGDGNDIGSVELQANELPVELISFQARWTDEGGLLTWGTASELNNSGFEVQYSKDGLNWEQIAFVKGSGTTLEEKTYKWLDKDIKHGQNYYRLKQIDYDGQFSFSLIRNIYFDKEVEVQFMLYPNPAKEQVFFQFSEERWSEEYCLFQLYDGHGRMVRKWVRYDNGPLNLDDLPSGIYILSAYYGTLHFKELLVKE